MDNPDSSAVSTTALLDNQRALAPLIERFVRSPIPHFIDGRPHAGSGAVFSNICPVDNSPICTVAAGTSADIDLACTAASRAFPSWRDVPGDERRALLHKLADAIEARARDIALVESHDTGQALRFMNKAALRGAENFRFFADRAPGARDGQSLPATDHLNYTLRQPIGPVGVITPWNTPFMLSTWKIAPALAAGCTVVHKPAEWSPISAQLLVEILHEAGLPAGVLNTVHGTGEVAGKALTQHPLIKSIAFVGDTATGRAIMAQGASTLKRVHFELGGKNPVMVFADAGLDRALEAVIFMIYSLNGERCTSSSRLLIQASIHDQFVEKLRLRIAQLKVGHPLDPATEVGPLIHPGHLDKVCGYFDKATHDGARIAAGGTRHPLLTGGNFVMPTLFTHATPEMAIAQEEIFGPVLTTLKFTDEADALEKANGVAFGLAAYLWTSNVGRAMRMARDLDAGMVWVNSENNRHLPSPFGGMKASGIGRDGGDYSFDFYMETKNVCIAMDTHVIPTLGKS